MKANNPTILFRKAALPGRVTAGLYAVLVRGERIAWVGPDAEIPTGRAGCVIDCGGATLLPGLHDAHIHLLAYAASLQDVDCGPASARSLADIGRLLGERAASTPVGQWVRGRGYDEFYLAEERYPDRHDLDAVTTSHPMRLEHRSGHACVLNSLALERVGIGPGTPDPMEGVIERDEGGAPTGVLYEMGGWLGQRTGEERDPLAMAEAVAEASRRLLGWGVTSVTDATAENDLSRWEALRRYQGEGLLKQGVTVMPGVRRLKAFVEAGLGYGRGSDMLRVGHAKLMAALTTGGLHPSEPELRELVAEAHRLGFPVAIHAVEEETILAALRVLCHSEQAKRSEESLLVRDSFGRPDTSGLPQNDNVRSDRLEHCSEATPAVLAALKAAGIAVCTNPGFLYESGERYRETVAPEVLPWLYPVRSLLEAGVTALAGSDAPVAAANPWQGVYAAVTRKDADRQALHSEQGVTLEQALALYGAAGPVRVGDRADLALLDRDVAQVSPEELLQMRAVAVVVGGEVVWEG
ncbi:MAG: amidohydrolase [Chloroflexi bacterium]|nr:amidohydrolase [Chloroflexota bacterium]